MSPRRQFEDRIERLNLEREYARPGWRVRIRRVTVPGISFRLSLKSWLMYPLLGA